MGYIIISVPITVNGIVVGYNLKFDRTAQHEYVDGQKVGSAPDMIKNDNISYLKYVYNLAEILAVKFDKKLDKMDYGLFMNLAEYARKNDVSLMGIIHYHIAKLRNLKVFTLPYPTLADKGNGAVPFGWQKWIGTAALINEKENYEKWIKSTKIYIQKMESGVEINRRTEEKYVPSNGGTPVKITYEYEATFKW